MHEDTAVLSQIKTYEDGKQCHSSNFLENSNLNVTHFYYKRIYRYFNFCFNFQIVNINGYDPYKQNFFGAKF